MHATSIVAFIPDTTNGRSVAFDEPPAPSIFTALLMTSCKLFYPPPPTSRSVPVRLGPPPRPPKALCTAAAPETQDELDRALSNDDKVLAQIECKRQKEDFWSFLHDHQSEIEAIVSFHLRLKTCQVGYVDTCLSGSYNVCVPVGPLSDAWVLVRIPYLAKLEKQSILGTWMRSFDARLLHICGFKRTAQMFQYLGYLAVDFLVGTRSHVKIMSLRKQL